MELDIQGLSIGRGGFRLRADLRLGSGEFGVIVGASGSGKSTILRCIAGLLTPDSGEILLGGRKLAKLPPEKRNIGFVFQDFALFPQLSARGNIEYGLKRHGTAAPERKRICEELAVALRIGDLLDRRPQSLSGGEQQRIALARALALSPDLILMDEPLSALDETLRRELRSLIRERLESLGITTLYVTHDTTEALSLADRLFVMGNGAISHAGRPEDLLSDPPDGVFVRFMSLGPLIPVSEMRKTAKGMLCETVAGPFLCRARDGLPGSRKVGDCRLYFPRWAASTEPHTVDLGSVDAKASPSDSFAGVLESRMNSFRAIVLSSKPGGRSRTLEISICVENARTPETGDSGGFRAEIEIESGTALRTGDRAVFHVSPESCILLPAGSHEGDER